MIVSSPSEVTTPGSSLASSNTKMIMWTVSDLVYERKGEVWEFHRSSYRKVRLTSVHIHDLFLKVGFEIVSSKIEDGFFTVIAHK